MMNGEHNMTTNVETAMYEVRDNENAQLIMIAPANTIMKIFRFKPEAIARMIRTTMDGDACVMYNQRETIVVKAVTAIIDDAQRTFGDRLGEMIVEFSECLDDAQRSNVLADLQESTSVDAYEEPAYKIAAILLQACGVDATVYPWYPTK